MDYEKTKCFNGEYLKIVQDIEVLRKKSEPITTVGEAKFLITELENTLKPLGNGIGLAAVQIGQNKRLGVIKKGNGFIHLINPELLEAEDEMIFVGEGCLSFPDTFRDTKRYRQITIKNQRIEDDHFEDEKLVFYYSKEDEPGTDGLIAIAVQHELDHFCGRLIIDYDIKAIPAERENKKVGRNDPCPCGSGKKYKKCCKK
jgi:peptide deformylase